MIRSWFKIFVFVFLFSGQLTLAADTKIDIIWPGDWPFHEVDGKAPWLDLKDEEAPAIFFYASTRADKKNSPIRISDSEWQTFSPQEKERNLLAWQGPEGAVCFRGHGGDVAVSFFGITSNEKIAVQNFTDITVQFSSDGKAISIGYRKVGKPRWYLMRIPRCLPGKQPSQKSIASPYPKLRQTKYIESLKNRVESEPVKSRDYREGFKVSDTLPPGQKNLHHVSLKVDYFKASQAIANEAKTLPWQNSALDLQKREDALEFAYMMLAYVYEGMVNQKKAEEDFDPHKSFRFWCQMPWLSTPWLRTSPKGRESLHGLLTATTEILPSEQFYPQMKEDVENTGKNLDTGFYNAWACKTLGDVFGSHEEAREPNWGASSFLPNSVAFKLMWTTADFKGISISTNYFSGIHDAPVWHAHTASSLLKKSVLPVRLFQIDLAVKSTLKGSDPQVNNWVMMAFAFDENFNLQETSGWKYFLQMPLTPGFQHFRPIGLQLGLDHDQSIIFFRRVNGKLVPNVNGDTAGVLLTHQNEGMLSGPADTPNSTCMSCHSTSGTSVPAVPGFTFNREFVTCCANKNFDFNLQLELARKNFQTRGLHNPPQ